MQRAAWGHRRHDLWCCSSTRSSFSAGFASFASFAELFGRAYYCFSAALRSSALIVKQLSREHRPSAARAQDSVKIALCLSQSVGCILIAVLEATNSVPDEAGHTHNGTNEQIMPYGTP